MRRKNIFLILLILAVGGVAFAFGIGFNAPGVYKHTNVAPLNPALPEIGAMIVDSKTSTFFGNTGTPTSPNWILLAAPNPAYSAGYFQTSAWTQTTTAATYSAFANTTAGTFHVLTSNVLVVTRAPANVMGIKFTPASTTAAYAVSFKIPCKVTNQADFIGLKLIDITNNIEVSEAKHRLQVNVNNIDGYEVVVLSGIYVTPGSVLPVTLSVQGLGDTTGTVVNCGAAFGQANATWSVELIQ